MKRKLISFDAYRKIEEQSLTNAQAELVGAEEVLAKALDVDGLELACFGEEDVTFKTPQGSLVHANYQIKDGQLVLENIEELVIEEDSERKAARNVLSGLVDALLEANDQKAGQMFEDYLNIPLVRREMQVVSEDFKVTTSKPTGKHSSLWHKHQSRSLVAKRVRSRMKTLKRLSPSAKKQLARKRSIAANKLGGNSNPRWRTYARKIKPKVVQEWNTMCENVLGYLDYKEFGPVLTESQIMTDDRGNVTALAVPTAQKRNENKILSFNWKTLDHEVKVLRGKVKKLHEDQVFVKAMTDLKRYNNVSDNAALEETLEAVVSRWPDVLYLTQEELAEQIKNALDQSPTAKNWDDQTCTFMAEGILRTAHNAFTDKVRKISALAGVHTDITAECKECQDAYAEFKVVADKFYAQLDETDNADLRVFADLYKALAEVHKAAVTTGDEATKAEIENLMAECEAVLNREADIDLDLAENIANILTDIVEANVEGASDSWDVSNTPHDTVQGDHPRMNWAAKQHSAVPSNYLGDWGDEAPVSDGKSFKNGEADEMRNRSWANIGGEGIYPDLNNPYTPKPFGDYKMKGEKGADSDGESDWSRWQSGETWPALKNPYIPTEKVGLGGKGYKMNNDNLVVDK